MRLAIARIATISRLWRGLAFSVHIISGHPRSKWPNIALGRLSRRKGCMVNCEDGVMYITSVPKGGALKACFNSYRHKRLDMHHRYLFTEGHSYVKN